MSSDKAPSRANDSLGTGRRKTSVARVRLRAGSGKITINNRPMDEFFPVVTHRINVLAPLVATDRVGQVDVSARVSGGGITGQAGAVLLGIARALKTYDVALEPSLRDAGLLTRDSRMKERKKYGRKGARKSFQFSKR